jgi:HEAT repeat protein
MDLEKLVQIIEDMALQHDYPGFELRSLKLALPKETEQCSAKTFALALDHKDVIVKLAAIRWFINARPGTIKQYSQAVINCLQNEDEWVRLEAIALLEHTKLDNEALSQLLCRLFNDTSNEVRAAAVKAAGKLGANSSVVISGLKEACLDKDANVRAKAGKALRKLGAYES